MKPSKSPNRFTFQLESYLKHKKERGKPLDDENTAAMIDFYQSAKESADTQEADPNWYKNNMEADLRTTDWILNKVRNSKVYAQNLYAALCNNEFQKRDLWPVLKDDRWSCSWRYAGGIIANMREEGDYINWYCSGIQLVGDENSVEFVGEGYVTEEIKEDLLKLGWIVIENSANE